MALVASEPPRLTVYPVPHKISFAKGPAVCSAPKNVSAMYTPSAGRIQGC